MLLVCKTCSPLSRHCFTNNSLASAGWEGTRRDAWVISEAVLLVICKVGFVFKAGRACWISIEGLQFSVPWGTNGPPEMVIWEWSRGIDIVILTHRQLDIPQYDLVWTWNVPTFISLIPCLLIVQRFPTIAIQQIRHPPSFPSVSHSFLSFSPWYSTVNSSIAINAPWGVAWARTRARSAQAKWWKWDGLGKCWVWRWFYGWLLGWMNLQFGDGLLYILYGVSLYIFGGKTAQKICNSIFSCIEFATKYGKMWEVRHWSLWSSAYCMLTQAYIARAWENGM